MDLGELSAIRGGSLSGFLTAPGGVTTTGAVVQLEPLAATVPPGVREQLSRMELATEADRSGFFQLAGIVPGRYRLTARKDGLRAEEEIEIEVDEELHLRRLPLQGSHSLRVRVMPSRPPGGGSWIVLLSGAGIETREVVTSEGGAGSLEHLHDGTYSLSILSPDHQPVLARSVTVSEVQTLDLVTI